MPCFALVPDEVKKPGSRASQAEILGNGQIGIFEGLYPIIREQKRLEKKLERIHRGDRRTERSEVAAEEAGGTAVRIAGHAGSGTRL